MKFIIERDNLVKPLTRVNGPLSGCKILPILSHILLQVVEDFLIITGTDLEIEIVARVKLNSTYEIGSTTVSARKFFDICRSLPEGSIVTVTMDKSYMLIRSDRSSFYLSTLPATEFPNLKDWKNDLEFKVDQATLKRLIESTQFSMANQDVRYFLNGMLFEIEGQELRSVATDGHRLAVSSILINKYLPMYSVIVPRKGVTELMRMLEVCETPLILQIGKNNIRVRMKDYIFTSKLLNGHFPNYNCVFPKNPDKIIEVDCSLFKMSLVRVAILSNKKFRGIRLYLSNNKLKITANNSEQESAEEIIDIIYNGNKIEIGFNVNYLLDILNTIKCDNVRLFITDETSSIKIEDRANPSSSYVVMPMRL